MSLLVFLCMHVHFLLVVSYNLYSVLKLCHSSRCALDACQQLLGLIPTFKVVLEK